MSSINCPECNNANLKLYEKFSEKKGLASLLFIQCQDSCGYEKEFYTSKRPGKFYDVKIRMTYAMRSISNGYSSIQKFSALINLPQPMTAKSYNKSVSSLLNAAYEVAEETMIDAANELKGDSTDDVVDASISKDGSWQRRGYSSLNGTFTAMSLKTGKVLDCEIMTRYCKACKLKGKLKNSNPVALYENWMKKHRKNCPLNHSGSAGVMEVTGATRIFDRSVEKRELRYTEYLEDGDSKGFDFVASVPGRDIKAGVCGSCSKED